jgi:hypothetical protein
MKFLTVCEGGAVRSVALATILRWDYGQHAIPISGRFVDDDTLAMLTEWADLIIVLAPEYADRIPTDFTNKMRVWDIGPDKWRNSMHPELHNLLGEQVEKWKRAKWDI